MKNRFYSLFTICFLVAFTSCFKKLKGDIILKNITIINVEDGSLVAGKDIIIVDNKITNIVHHKSNTKYLAAIEIDATGKFVIPGLFDGHAHTNNYKLDFPRFMHYGVTSIFVPGGSTCTNRYFSEMRAMGSQDSIPAPRVYHTSQHFIKEGSHPVKTYNNSNWKEGETVYFLRDTLQIEKLVKHVSNYPIKGIKLTIEDGPDPPLIERISQTLINKVQKEALKQNTRVFAHISDNEELEMALNAGIYNYVHYTGVDINFKKDTLLLAKMHSKTINWVTTLMLDKSFIYPLNPDWIHDVKTENIFEAAQLAKINSPKYIARADSYVSFMKTHLQKETVGLKEVIEFQVNDIKVLFNKGINMVLGTDTGNTFIYPGYSLHEEMQLFELGGMQPINILKMGTINAAKMLEVDDQLGSITIDKLADLVILDKNPLDAIKNTRSIYLVIKNGKIQKRIKGH